MIYYCENCGFLFCRLGEIKTCPSCEGSNVSFACTEEASGLQAVLEEAIVQDRKIVWRDRWEKHKHQIK